MGFFFADLVSAEPRAVRDHGKRCTYIIPHKNCEPASYNLLGGSRWWTVKITQKQKYREDTPGRQLPLFIIIILHLQHCDSMIPPFLEPLTIQGDELLVQVEIRSKTLAHVNSRRMTSFPQQTICENKLTCRNDVIQIQDSEIMKQRGKLSCNACNIL